MSSDGYTVAGTITDATGAPLVGADVEAYEVREPGSERPLGQAPTGTDGRYVIHVHADGENHHDGGHDGDGDEHDRHGNGGGPGNGGDHGRDPHPDATVAIRVSVGGQVVGQSDPRPVQRPETVIDLQVDIAPSPPAVVVADSTLGIGARGLEVAALHTRLTQAEFSVPSSELQGQLFGVGTRDAVLELQQRAGRILTGVVDPATSTALDVAVTAVTFSRRVEGRLLLENGLPAVEVPLRLVNRGFGDAVAELGSAYTDARGFFTLDYSTEDEVHNLEVHAMLPDEQTIRLSSAKAAVPRNMVLNLVAPAEVAPPASEFARLAADVAGHVGPISNLGGAVEDGEHQDLATLTRATGWDARVVALAAIASQLHNETDGVLSHQGLYGLLRAGLPTNLNQLAQVRPEVITQALATVTEAGVIDFDEAQIGEFTQQFATLARATLLARPAPGSPSSIGQLLQNTALPADRQDAFASVFLHHNGTPGQLWEAARNAGIDNEEIAVLQLHGRYAFLSGNSAPVTGWLMAREENDPAALALAGLHQAEAWKDVITAVAATTQGGLAAVIPVTYQGNSEQERLDTYAADLARRIRFGYPTHVLTHQIGQDKKSRFRLDNAPNTAALLASAADNGFRLGQTPPTAYFHAHPDIDGGLPPEELAAAVTEVGKLHRVYQITRDDQTMAVLLQRGLHSAFDVVAVDEDTFVRLHADAIGNPDETRLVHRKAQQITNAASALVSTVQGLAAAPAVRVLSASPEVRSSVQDSLIRHIPSLESLFGTMDYCPCEHCRSVLGPAAYLVDLLQFIDIEANVWNSFLERWDTDHPEPYADRYLRPYDALVRRRPDLADLQLTCTNTSTELPYIDVVNEILEYYVAHGTLTPDAAHDTGDADAADLETEPQHVIREAYDALLAARYPLTLPFDLWLETVRRFCTALGTPLARLLEVFRSGDDLFAPTQPYDRAAIFLESLGLTPAQAAPLTDPTPLTDDAWYTLYGYSPARAAIAAAVNGAPATVTVPDIDAEPFTAGGHCTFLDAVTGTRSGENLVVASVGPPSSGGAGLTLITLDGVWQTPPEPGDQLIVDVPAALRSAATLARRLGVSYTELADLVATGFANPQLVPLVLLNNLGITVQQARLAHDRADFYEQNKDLLYVDPATLPLGDRARYDALSDVDPATGRSGWQDLLDMQVVHDRLTRLSQANGLDVTDLQAALSAIPFDRVLVLTGPTTGCDFTQTVLQHADGTPAEAIDLLRLNLLVRLWRTLGWPLNELDRAVTAFVPANTPYDAAHLEARPLRTVLILLSHLDTLHELLGQHAPTRVELLALWQNLDTRGPDSLYARLFLTPGMLRLDDVFDHPLGHYLDPAWVQARMQARTHWVELDHVAPADRLDPTEFTFDPRLQLRYDELADLQQLGYQGVLSDEAKAVLEAASSSAVLATLLDAVQVRAADDGRITGHLQALESALGLTATEIDEVLTVAGQSLDTAALTLPTVSLLYRHGLFACGLGLTVTQLHTLAGLSGLDPFPPLPVDPVTTLEDDLPYTRTVRFAEIAVAVDGSGLDLADLDFLLRHRFDPTGPHRDDPQARLTLLAGIAERVQAIRAEHAVPHDPGAMPDEWFRQQLGLVLDPAVADRFLTMLDGTVTFTVQLTGIQQAASLDLARFPAEPSISALTWDLVTGTQTATIRGVLFDGRKDRLNSTYAPVLTAEQQTTLAALLDAAQEVGQQEAEAFFATHLNQQPVTDDSTGGFLDPADFDLLLDPDLPLQPGQTPTDRQRHRRTVLATSFLPYLQRRLIREFVVTTVTAGSTAAPGLAEDLFTDPRLLGLPQPDGTRAPLLDAVVDAADPGVSVTVQTAGQPEATTRTLPGADLSLLGADLADATGARIEGHLRVPEAGAYRFYIRLANQGATADLRFDHLETSTLTGTAATDGTELGADTPVYVDLRPGVGYRFTVDLTDLASGTAQLLVHSATMPKGRLSRLSLLPAATVDVASASLTLQDKAMTVLQALELGREESRYLLTHPDDFDGLDLSALPTAPGIDPQTAQALFAQFLRLAGYAALRRDIAAGTEDLVTVFSAPDAATAYRRLSALTRRDETTVRETANALIAGTPQLTDERPVRQLWEALQVVTAVGAPVRSVRDWTRIVSPTATPEQRFGIARDLKDSLRARFDVDGWRRIARPVFDELRRQQRDALVAHVMLRLGYTQPEQLYEHFLIDPGMEPVVHTSRVRLAISSVQTFVHRILLNLEPQVPPAALINGDRWDAMKRYRVWEANRKIFLFPENYLEPEFRDDKTHLFTELEGTLLADDVSADLVEEALLTYLRKLGEIARLDIVSTYLEEFDDAARNVLHVIGRTYTSPHAYYYRRYAQSTWTPWEPISVDIEGDHVAPVVWRGRLHLFWVSFTEEPIPKDVTVPEVGAPIPANQDKRVIAKLHWTEYLRSSWSPPRSSQIGPGMGEGIELVRSGDFDSLSAPITVWKEDPMDGKEQGLYVQLSSSIGKWNQPGFPRSFYLPGRNSSVRAKRVFAVWSTPYSANSHHQATRLWGDETFHVSVPQPLGADDKPSTWIPILRLIRPYSLVPAVNPPSHSLGELGPLLTPVFFQDEENTFFIEPHLAEETVAGWQGWVTPFQALDNPVHWQELPLAPAVAGPAAVARPGTDWRFTLDETALFALRSSTDWLIGTQATVRYGDAEIGAEGSVERDAPSIQTARPVPMARPIRTTRPGQGS